MHRMNIAHYQREAEGDRKFCLWMAKESSCDIQYQQIKYTIKAFSLVHNKKHDFHSTVNVL
jgi:hypothetical protein